MANITSNKHSDPILEKSERIRSLVNNERKFYLSPNANVSVVARLRGTIDENELSQAITWACQIHPLLKCRVEFDELSTAWYTSENVPSPSLEVFERTSPDDWMNIITKAFENPFDRKTGPLIRFFLVKGNNSPPISELIVFSNHSICDGTALANLLRNIFTYMTTPPEFAEKPKPLYPPKNTDFIHFDEIFSSFSGKLKRAVLKKLSQKWQSAPLTFDSEDHQAIQQAFTNRFKYRIQLLELDETQTAHLVQNCRHNGVTINSALTVAFISAYNDLNPEFTYSKPEVAMAYDLRTRTNPPLGDVFCLMVGTVLLKVKPMDFNSYSEKKFLHSVGPVHRKVLPKIDGKSMFAAAANLELLPSTMIDTMFTAFRADIVPPSSPRSKHIQSILGDSGNLAVKFSKKFQTALPQMVNTNLGRVSIPTQFSTPLGNFELTNMYFAPPPARSIPLIIGAIGAARKMTVTINWFENREQPKQTEKYSDLFERVKQRALNYLGFV